MERKLFFIKFNQSFIFELIKKLMELKNLSVILKIYELID